MTALEFSVIAKSTESIPRCLRESSEDRAADTADAKLRAEPFRVSLSIAVGFRQHGEYVKRKKRTQSRTAFMRTQFVVQNEW